MQYNADTGELQIIDPDPAVAQVVLVGGPFQPGQFQQPPSTSVLLVNSSNLSILFLNPQPAGPVSFGPFLPAGLDQQQFEGRITAATSQGRAMTLAYVPEPASVSLLALGATALMRRRRG
ncbi:MAG: PEP-CTERM sorting domain-containing protein [Phycisphaeraceae bacterium]